MTTKKKHVASDTKVTNRARFYFKSSRTGYDDEIAIKTLPVNKEHTLNVYIKHHGRFAHVPNLGSNQRHTPTAFTDPWIWREVLNRR